MQLASSLHVTADVINVSATRNTKRAMAAPQQSVIVSPATCKDHRAAVYKIHVTSASATEGPQIP
jgi:hypothetical protein